MRAAAALRKAPALKKPAAADDSDKERDILLGGEIDHDGESPAKKTGRHGLSKKKTAAAFVAPTRGAHTSRAYDATARDLKRKGHSADEVQTKGRAA